MSRFLLLCLLPLASFGQNAQEFELKGKLDLHMPVEWVLLRYVAGDGARIDSVQPKNGEFKIKGEISEPLAAMMMVRYAGTGTARSQREVIQIFLEPAKIELEAKDSLKHFTLKGSEGQRDFTALLKDQERYSGRLNALYGQYDSLQQLGKTEELARTERSIEDLNNELKESVYASFLKKHPQSKVSLYALNQYAGWDLDPAKVEPLFLSLPASVRSLPSAKSLEERIKIAKKTAVGSYALDFTQNDTLGRPVSLSSFRGKYVLVDFWASWCGPCRKENPNIVRVFNKFRDKKFTILGVSLDRPDAREKWLAAIHKDGLTWTHVSDLKYWDNEVAKQYGIRAIPQNLLLNPEGKIIAKNLRGEDLDEKLSALIR